MPSHPALTLDRVLKVLVGPFFARAKMERPEAWQRRVWCVVCACSGRTWMIGPDSVEKQAAGNSIKQKRDKCWQIQKLAWNLSQHNRTSTLISDSTAYPSISPPRPSRGACLRRCARSHRPDRARSAAVPLRSHHRQATTASRRRGAEVQCLLSCHRFHLLSLTKPFISLLWKLAKHQIA